MLLLLNRASSLILLLSAAVVHAQFSCTFSGAKDESTCVKATEKDGSDHCVWCDVGGAGTTKGTSTAFGFCVSEIQAETIEQTVPSAHCDRYSDGDDDTSTDDDYSMPDDDQAPSDDAIPSDYWECLKHADAKSCNAGDDCTWCDTPVGYGVCMAGPSADAAKESAWFTCVDTTSRDDDDDTATVAEWTIQDPMDPSCLVAFLQDQSEEGCEAALDADGNPCEFCTLQGAFQLCLNEEQAAMGEQFGLECDDRTFVEDPMDPSCLVAFLQDQSEEGCTAALDADGNPCEFCTLQGAFQVCLNEDQAAMGEQFGVTCSEASATTTASASSFVQDPMDPSCLVAFLQDQSEEGCQAAMDADGNPCEFCTLQGAFQLCLNEEQAAMGEQFGVECDETTATVVVAASSVEDPMDPSCLAAFLLDQSPEGCKAAVDADGNACEFCILQGAFQLCLNEEQAAMGEQFGVTCEESVSEVQDPMDPSCLVAFLQDQSEEGCEAALDADGNPCEFCILQGAFQLCLNEEQAAMGEQFGLECDEDSSSMGSIEASSSSSSLFDELSECLEHYQEDDCFHSSCTWCNTQVGMGFCLTPGFAQITKEWNFFDCEFQQVVVAVE